MPRWPALLSACAIVLLFESPGVAVPTTAARR